MNLLLDSGTIPLEKLINTLKDFSKSNSLFLINRKAKERYSTEIFEKFQVFDYGQISYGGDQYLNAKAKGQYIKILNLVLNDHRTILIAERVGLVAKFKSVHNLEKELEKAIFSIINFLLNHDIDCVMFQATPHGIHEWLLGRVAEGLGIPVFMIQTSPIPWRFRIIKGIDNSEILKIEDNIVNIEDPYLEGFIRTNLSDYKNAIPDYEKNRIQSRKGKFWSWRKELKDFISFPRPKLLRNIFYKKALFTHYNNLCTMHIDKTAKSIVFFMHYQPERTSLPEGGIFAQQWLLIKSLSIALPPNWKLYVKEHPSIFTGKFVPQYRDKTFYDDISRLPNVQMIPLDYDTFELIDSSMAIATITGTVGIQSLIRGKPVFLFGNGSYKEFKGVYTIKSIQEIEEALQSIKMNDEIVSKQQTSDSFHEILKNTIGAYSSSNLDPDFSYYNLKNRVKGHLILLETILKTDFFDKV